MSDSGYSTLGVQVQPDGTISATFRNTLGVLTDGTGNAGENFLTLTHDGFLAVPISYSRQLASLSSRLTSASRGIAEHSLEWQSGGSIAGLSGYTEGPSPPPGQVRAEVNVMANTAAGGSRERLLLNQAGQSDFLALADGPQLLELAMGEGEIEFVGDGPNEYAEVTVDHSLGRGPWFASAVGIAPFSSLFYNVTSSGIVTADASTITFGAQIVNGWTAAGTWGFRWIALG